MEQRGGANALALTLEGGAAGKLGIFKGPARGEMPVDQARVGQRLYVLGGLQLGRKGRKDEQVDMLGHAQAHAGTPPLPIEHEHDLFVGIRTYLAHEVREFDFAEGDKRWWPDETPCDQTTAGRIRRRERHSKR